MDNPRKHLLTPNLSDVGFSNTNPKPGGALNENITDVNFLNPMGFQFSIKRAPYIQFFIQKIILPGLTLQPTHYPNPFINIPESGEHISFNPLTIQFKVDENLTNYKEVHNWLYGLGKPESFKEYRHLSEKPQFLGFGLKSDISLLIQTGIKNPNINIVFVDAFPISLSDIQFDTTPTDIMYVSVSATFKYTYYEIHMIPV
jgi:hypothetical protein